MSFLCTAISLQTQRLRARAMQAYCINDREFGLRAFDASLRIFRSMAWLGSLRWINSVYSICQQIHTENKNNIEDWMSAHTVLWESNRSLLVLVQTRTSRQENVIHVPLLYTNLLWSGWVISLLHWWGNLHPEGESHPSWRRFIKTTRYIYIFNNNSMFLYRCPLKLFCQYSVVSVRGVIMNKATHGPWGWQSWSSIFDSILYCLLINISSWMWRTPWFLTNRFSYHYMAYIWRCFWWF